MLRAKELGRKAAWFAKTRAPIDLGGDPNNSTVLLAGMHRSGTTLLGEILNHGLKYRYMWEPFFYHEVPLCRDFKGWQYLPPESEDPTYTVPIRNILRGRIRNKFVDAYNPRFISRRRMIKDTRANMLLRWIHTHYPRMPVIVLVRHPFAVALSWMRLGWDPLLDDVTDQPKLIKDHLKPFETIMSSDLNVFEQHVLGWCVYNYVTLVMLRDTNVHFVFYEELVEEPRRVIPELYSVIGERVHDSVYDRLKRPSHSSFDNDPAQKQKDRVTARLASEMDYPLNRAMDIVREFNLDCIYPDPEILADDPLDTFYEAL